MSDTATNLYEGLFLISQQEMAGDVDGAINSVREMLDRAEAEVLSLRRWDERKLAYSIAGQKRGLYVISLFKARPTQIANIERDCNLSELILRVMMTRCDHMGEIEINEELEAQNTASDEAKLRAAGESTEQAPAEENDSDNAEATSEETADAAS